MHPTLGPMHNPPHPGAVLRELYLAPLRLSVTGFAKDIGISRKTLSEILMGKAGISPLMALRLAKCFNTTAEFWLSQQQAYDLWRLRKTVKLGRIKSYAAQNSERAVVSVF